MKTAIPEVILTHWNVLIRDLTYSSEEFYKSLEEKIAKHEVPAINQSRVDFKEGTSMSRKRKYLRIQNGDLVFDICGAPYGTESFFVSYWLGVVQRKGCLYNLLLFIPFLGGILEKGLKPLTYYQVDTAAMFQSLIHELVMEAVQEIQEAHELEPLTHEERIANTKKLDQF